MAQEIVSLSALERTIVVPGWRKDYGVRIATQFGSRDMVVCYPSDCNTFVPHEYRYAVFKFVAKCIVSGAIRVLSLEQRCSFLDVDALLPPFCYSDLVEEVAVNSTMRCWYNDDRRQIPAPSFVHEMLL